jgi:hypothetical protein
MKKLLNTALILNVVTDGPGGLFLLFSPQSFLPADQVEGLFWVRNYGVAALAVASMIFWVWSCRDSYKAMGVALGFLLAFHTVLCMVLITAGNQMVGVVLHFILATLFIILYLNRPKWCDSQ